MSLLTVGSRPTRFRRIRVCLLISLLATSTLLLVGLRHSPPVAHASGGLEPTFFVHTATPANSFYDYTEFYYDEPSAVFTVTPNWNSGGSFGGVYDNHPIGVFFSGGYWCIFNQDGTPIPIGASFNVFGGSGYFVQTATSTNSSSDYTKIDTPSLNFQPTMRMLVTPTWKGVYDNHPIGVFYSLNDGHWYIFNQDYTAIPSGAAFNVQFFSSTDPTDVVLQTATNANSFSDYTTIDDPWANIHPKAILIVTPDYNPGGVGGVHENHNIGVFYSSFYGRWCIFNQDHTAIPKGAAFYVLIISL